MFILKFLQQLGPILELWNTLTSSTPGLINRRAGAAGGGGAANKKMLDPVDDFVLMENDLAGDICGVVDGALASLKKVLNFSDSMLSFVM